MASSGHKLGRSRYQPAAPAPNMTKTILCVVGTRPEAIKMAPIILALQQETWVRTRILATAQHREMLDNTLSLFQIQPDVDLDIMRPNQALADVTARLLTSLDQAMEKELPDLVLAQGDTTTVLTTALAAFYRKIPFGHVEAGLRTGDPVNPFPEEMNRVVASRLATLHFAPTDRARANLLAEGIAANNIFVTGNTVIDALLTTADRNIRLDFELPDGRRIVLVTAHRRENFGAPLKSILNAIRTLSLRNPDLHFVYPVHPNPNVSGPARDALTGVQNVTLCAPLNYGQLVALMKRSWLVLTDSGGMQEEAPALGIPVLVLREETERPEAVEAGVARLLGSNHDSIVEAVERLLVDGPMYSSMARGSSPFGDGKAAQRIVAILRQQMDAPHDS